MPRSTGAQPPNVARSAPLGGSQTPINGPAAHRSGPTGLHPSRPRRGGFASLTSPSPAHHHRPGDRQARSTTHQPASAHHHHPMSPCPPTHHMSPHSTAERPAPPAHGPHHRPTARPPARRSPLAGPPCPPPRQIAQGPPAPGPPSPLAGARGDALAPVSHTPTQAVKQGVDAGFSACRIGFQRRGAGPGVGNWAMMGPDFSERLPKLDFLELLLPGVVGAGANWRSNANQVGR